MILGLDMRHDILTVGGRLATLLAGGCRGTALTRPSGSRPRARPPWLHAFPNPFRAALPLARVAPPRPGWCHAACLLLLLWFGLPFPADAQFAYAYTNGALTITGYTGPGGPVVIPAAVNGVPVTAVGNSAFSNCTSLASLTIGTNVTTVGTSAFQNCTLLASAAIPNSVTTLGSFAFCGCFALTTAALPTNLTSIGNNAFGSSGLTSVAIPDSVTNLASNAFGNCGNLAHVIIGNGVKSIGDYAFQHCPSLTRVTIPNGLTSIGASAFWSCTSLASATIPNGVTNIGAWAFSGCTGLTNVTLGSSVASLGASAFATCGNLFTCVYVQGDAPAADSSVFDGDNYATVYYLPSAVGWGPFFANRPTVLWLPQVEAGPDSLGVRTNQFGFTVNWADTMTVAVDACTNLANPVWSPLVTNSLPSGSFYFSDPQWTNSPARFYRLRWP